MDDTLANALLQITGNLSPVAGSTAAQLSQLRSDLAEALRSQSLTEILAPDSKNLQVIFSTEAFTTQDSANLVNELASTIAPPAEAEALPAETKVFRREFPVVTSQHAASTPKWAAGQKINYTLGPFVDGFGKMVWFDFYRFHRQVKVARGNPGAVFLSLPISGHLLGSNSYNLDKGSLWFISNQLAASAPAGAFTGLRIKRGVLTIDGPMTISGDTIVIGNTNPCKVDLELDQPDAPNILTTNTGDDAKQMKITLPAAVTLLFNAGSIKILEVDRMDLSEYGEAYQFTKASLASQFDPYVNRILVPFDADFAQVKIGAVKSQLFQPAQAASIKLSAWALPVSLAGNVNHLGQAAGIGAICLILDEGLRAVWKGFEKGSAQLKQCYLLAEPGRIAITAPFASAHNGKQHYELWEENNPTRKIRSQANIAYPKQFMVLYNCLSSGNEVTILLELNSDFTIDRPVRANKQRLKITTDKTELALIETNSITTLFIHAMDILQSTIANKHPEETTPISFALSNALIKTTPVEDLYLLGQLEDDKKISKGALAIICHIYELIPSLPDPYVSSFQPAFNRDFYRLLNNDVATEAAGYQNGTGVSLLGFIQWPAPDAPLLMFAFIGSSLSSMQNMVPVKQAPANQVAQVGNQGLAASPLLSRSSYVRGSQAREVMREDQANLEKLRSYFDDVLRTSREQIYMLDVSTNADLLGVGLNIFGRRDTPPKLQGGLTASYGKYPFVIIGVDLSTFASNTRLYMLPEIQWEPIRTIQNPDVKPYPFPSPATSPDTGNPTLIGTDVYQLVPIAPRPVVNKIVTVYNDETNPARVAGLFTLPFGMSAAALWDNAFDNSQPGAAISFNQPKFDADKVVGGIQISVLATSPDVGDDFETAGFKGATIQTRNLVELLTGIIPLDDNGKPLSVLGPVVDTIFNNDFEPGGANPRVPVNRIDFSGYGATLFSNWLNPNAEIAATSQARFDVWRGRTSHEVIQVKSILYPWGLAVVRTITIQRTSGGGVTRYDSGWKAQGPGIYDFSYVVVGSGSKTTVPNPFEFHPGVIKGIYNVTGIKDTGRIYNKPGGIPADDVTMQEVFFDADVFVDDVQLGASGGFVPSKKQRGFVQLAPYQKPLTPLQFYILLQEEGSLGGPLDCVIDVGHSGQPMRIIKIDVSGVDNFGSYLFVSVGHGSLQLPKEGSWSLVKRKENTKDIISIAEDAGLPVIREGQLNTVPTQPYRFADPGDILHAASPTSDYGLLQSTGSQKVLFLRPTIQRNDANIKSALRPYFGDSFAILGSVAIFPNLDTTFQLGTAGTNLQVNGPGLLKLTSGGNFKAPVGYTRDLLNNGSSRIYVDYSDVAGSGDTTDIAYAFDAQAPVPWLANLKRQSIIVDLSLFKGLVTVTTEFDAAADKHPEMSNPKIKFGSILQPIVDILQFLGDFDMGQAFSVGMGNATVDSWQPKFKASLKGFQLEWEAPTKLKIRVFGVSIKTVPQTPGVTKSPIKISIELEIEAHYNMNPLSITSNDPSTDLVAARNDMLSVGASLKIGGEIKIFCTTVGVVDLYLVGILEFEFGIDSKEGKSFGFKVAVGLELSTTWPIVGEVAVMMALGLEMVWKDSGSEVFGLIIFKGEAELLEGLIVIGIGIEAKGGQEKETHGAVEETFCVCEVEFAAEVTLAFVIHFEFDVTWQEKKQLS
jgi:hypothetical protein